LNIEKKTPLLRRED